MLPPLLPPRSHLALKRGVFYYRRKLLRPRSGEVAVSLRTKYFREAQCLAKLLDRKFMRLSVAMPQAPDLRAILQKELREAVESERQRHIETPAGTPVYAYWVEPEDGDALGADLRQLQADIEGARASVQRRDTIGISEWVDDVIAKHRLPRELWKELALGLARVRVQRLERGMEYLTQGVAPEISLQVAPQATACDAPDPIEAIRFRMEQGGLTVKALVPSIGQPNRVYEVLNRKRSLTIEMIRNLHRNLGIPVESLIGV